MTTIADYRKRIPALDGLSDQEVYGLVSQQGYEIEPIPRNTSALQDTGTALKQGLYQIPGAVAALAELPATLLTGERPYTQAANWLGEQTGIQPGKWSRELEDVKSQAYHQARQDVNAAWGEQQGKGILDQLGQLFTDPNIAGAYLRNPRAVLDMVAQSAPSMVAGGVLGRAAGAAGRVAGVAEAEGVAARAAIPSYLERALGPNNVAWASPLAAGIGEGGFAAGSALSQYDPNLPNQQRAALAALGAGAVTGGIGAVAGRGMQAMGLETLETAMAGRLGRGEAADLLHTAPKAPGFWERGGRTRAVVGGGLGESGQEFLQSGQEQAWQNIAEGKNWQENVIRSGVEGAMAGFAMGGPVNINAGVRAQGAYNQAVEAQRAREELVRNNSWDMLGTATDQWVQRGIAADAQRAAVAADWAGQMGGGLSPFSGFAEQYANTEFQNPFQARQEQLMAAQRAALEQRQAQYSGKTDMSVLPQEDVELPNEVDVDTTVPPAQLRAPLAQQQLEEEEAAATTAPPAGAVKTQIASLAREATRYEAEAAAHGAKAKGFADKAASLKSKPAKKKALADQQAAEAAQKKSLAAAEQVKGRIAELSQLLPAQSVQTQQQRDALQPKQEAQNASGQGIPQGADGQGQGNVGVSVQQAGTAGVGASSTQTAQAKAVPGQTKQGGKAEDIIAAAETPDAQTAPELDAEVVTAAKKRKGVSKPAWGKTKESSDYVKLRSLVHLINKAKKTPAKLLEAARTVLGEKVSSLVDDIQNLTKERDRLLNIFSSGRTYYESKQGDKTVWRRKTVGKVKQTVYTSEQGQVVGNIEDFYDARYKELQDVTKRLHDAFLALENEVGFNNIQSAQEVSKREAKGGVQSSGASLFSREYNTFNRGDATAEAPMSGTLSKTIRERRELKDFVKTKLPDVYANGFKFGGKTYQGIEAILMKLRFHSGNPFVAHLSSNLYYMIRDAKKEGMQEPTVLFYTEEGLFDPKTRQIDKTKKAPHKVGSYDSNTNTIHIGPEGHSAEIVIHETLHAALAGYIEKNADKPVVKSLEALRKHVVEALKKDARGVPAVVIQAISDPATGIQEFLSYGLTNRDLQEAMQKIKPSEDKTLTGFIKDTWNGFVAIMRKILGLPADYQQAFSQYLHVTGELLGTGYVEQYSGGNLNAIDGKKTLDILQKLENGKLQMDGPYGFNTVLAAWKEAQQLQKEYPDETVYDLFRDSGSTIIYGAGGYQRYTVNSEGNVVPLDNSFSSKEKLAAAKEALGGAGILNATTAKEVYGRIRDFFDRLVDTVGSSIFKIKPMKAGPQSMEAVLKHHMGEDVFFEEVPSYKLGAYSTAEGTPTAGWRVYMPGRGQAIIFETNGTVSIQTPSLRTGQSSGWKAVQAAIAYAYHNKKMFVNELDSISMSAKAVERYTEHMLTAAIKYGTTDFMLPHRRQLDVSSFLEGEASQEDSKQAEKWAKGALSGLAGWKSKAAFPKLSPEERTVHNLKLLAEVTAERTLDGAPELRKYTFDFAKGFLDEKGQPVPGLTTQEKRAILVNQLSDMGSVEYRNAIAGTELQDADTTKDLGLAGVLYAKVASGAVQTATNNSAALPAGMGQYAPTQAWLEPIFRGMFPSMWGDDPKMMRTMDSWAAKIYDEVKTRSPSLAKFVGYLYAPANVSAEIEAIVQSFKKGRNAPVAAANEFGRWIEYASKEDILAAFAYMDNPKAPTTIPDHLKQKVDDAKQALMDAVNSLPEEENSTKTNTKAVELRNRMLKLRPSEMLTHALMASNVTSSSFGAREEKLVGAKMTFPVAAVKLPAEGGKYYAILDKNKNVAEMLPQEVVEGNPAAYKDNLGKLYIMGRLDKSATKANGEDTMTFHELTTVRDLMSDPTLKNRATEAIATSFLNTVSLMANAVATRKLTSDIARAGEGSVVFDGKKDLLEMLNRGRPADEKMRKKDVYVTKLSSQEARSKIIRAEDRKPGNWVQLPGSSAYGELAGKIVEGPVWARIQDALNRSAVVDNAAYNTLITTFKAFKTKLNPATHVTNIMSNFTLAYMHNISFHTMRSATSLYLRYKTAPGTLSKQELQLMSAFHKSGATLGDYSTNEVKRIMYETMAAKSESSGVGYINEMLAWAKYEGSLAQKAAELARKTGRTVDDISSEIYATGDNMFRFAAFLSKMGELEKTHSEYSPEQRVDMAGTFAKKAFMDYDIDSRAVQFARQTVYPFISWPYAFAGVLGSIAKNQPWKIATLVLVYSMVAGALGDSDDEERKQRKRAKKDEKTWFGADKSWRIYKDGERSVYFDAARWFMPTPIEFKDQPNGFLGFHSFPSALIPSNPVLTSIMAMSGYDPYTGKSLHKDTNTSFENTRASLAKVGEQFTPPWASQRILPAKPGLTGSEPSQALHYTRVFLAPVSEVNDADKRKGLEMEINRAKRAFDTEIGTVKKSYRYPVAEKAEIIKSLEAKKAERLAELKEARG